MITASTHLYLLNYSANPVSTLHRSSAEAEIFFISSLNNACRGEGLATSFAVRLQHKTSVFIRDMLYTTACTAD